MHILQASHPRPGSFVEFARDEIEQSIPARFAQQVARHEHRLAVGAEDGTLTYGELAAAANAVAVAVLERLGEEPEPVALLYGQGTPLVAAILGILAAGKAYVPLDPSYPEARLAGMLEDVGARLVATDAANLELAGRLGPDVLAADCLGAAGEAPALAVSPDAPAYVFYTSGSTGEPKGVVDCHRNVLHNVMRYTNGLHISPSDRLTLLQAASFSGAVSSLFGALLNGAAVFPFDLHAEGVGRVAAWLAEHELTIYHSVPAIFRRVAAEPLACSSLRLIRLEGDQASKRDLELFNANAPAGCVLVNGLGATECGIVRRLFVERGAEIAGDTVPIGYPVEDMEVLVLDAEGAEVAAGEIGEIGVRSRYLALGYWRRPDLTEAAFRAAPAGGGGRIYRTGDVGRMRFDGCLEHLGRKDFQAKVRGHRVEVEAIEAALLATPGVREVAVTTRPGPDGEPRIVAYVVADADPPPTVGELRRRLGERVPAHAIPSRFVTLGALPLDGNGKVDRRALPDLAGSRPALAGPAIPPRSSLERRLAEIWEDLLGVGPVGIRDDFLELGGDSLLAATLLARIEEAFGRSLPFSILAGSGTVEKLAHAVLDRVGSAEGPIVEIQRGGSKRPFCYAYGHFVAGALYCRRLAHELGPERRFLAVAPHGLGQEAVPPTIEAMAADRLEALRELWPASPYLLGGHCQGGGLVALEMARQLEAAGEEVELLVLIETLPPYTRAGVLPAARAVRWLVERTGRAAGLDAAERAALFVRLRERVVGATGGSRRPPDRQPPRADVMDAYCRAIWSYVPGRYGGRVLVLWPESGAGLPPDEARAAWRHIAPNIELRPVPGDHYTSITTHLASVAEQISAALGDAGGPYRSSTA